VPDEACRLAKIEQRVYSLSDDLKEQDDKLCEIHEILEKMRSEQARYKGFIGGIVFTIGAIFSFVSWWTNK
jgi:hypothetical protein